MADEYRDVVIRQGAHWATSTLAERIRNGRKKTPALEDEPEPKPEDRPALRAAEAMVAGQAPAPGESMAEIAYGPIVAPDDLFAEVEDREEAKLILLHALRSKSAVHVLLLGDPASGKSELLKCVTRLPHTRYAVGGMTTSSGMIDYLLERRSTQILVIDELDKCETEDYAALYSLLESGTVPRLQHGKTEVLQFRGRVFAACNTTERMPEALLSRFVVVRLAPYSSDQVRHITETVLTRREGLSPARARQIAELTAARSRDPRDGIQIGRLAGEDADFGPIADQVVAKSGESG